MRAAVARRRAAVRETARRRGAAIALAVALAACGAPAGEAVAGRNVASAAEPTAAPKPAESRPATPAAPVRHLRVEVVESFPHDTAAYTQGLVLDDGGELLESTGRYGTSDLRRVELASGRVIRRTPLPKGWFGEGLALLPAGVGSDDGQGDAARLVQITWREGVAALWDAVSFRRLGERSYSGEGWGLCWDDAGRRLVMSDGSDWLTFRDPSTFAALDGVAVTLNGRPVRSLNELECVGGRVWANLYGSENLVEIDPADGRVTAVVDASGLLTARERHGVDVLNGIAFDPGDGTFLLTGKLWPKLFRVRMVAASAAP